MVELGSISVVRKVRLRERGTGRVVQASISPSMTPDEVLEAIRAAANIREPVILWRRDSRGNEIPVTGVHGRDLIDAYESGVEIMFEPRRVYG